MQHIKSVTAPCAIYGHGAVGPFRQLNNVLELGLAIVQKARFCEQA